MIGIVMFGVALLMLLVGFPVAFTFGGVALLFGVFAEGAEMFAFMPFRIQSIMENTVLMAVPLFIFMGIVLQKTQLAEQLLESMGKLFGGCAVSCFYRCGRCVRCGNGLDLSSRNAQV